MKGECSKKRCLRRAVVCSSGFEKNSGLEV